MSCCTRILKKINSKNIEEDDFGKAKQFALCSIARPHMRSFHSSWFCFFAAFTSWFSIQPLLPTIRRELHLSKLDLANSGIASVAATIAIRVIIGPLCDKFGPRKTMSGLLIAVAIPMALCGLITSGTGLIIIRLFVGILGGTFVPCQFWTSSMFNTKIVGTANAIVGGWGNLGGGFTFLLMPGLFQLMKVIGADEFLAWKIAVVIPALVCIALGTF
jgi:NNP family nitrate/nitrite transporter-like MFS transporter